ncbi:hypothetical protein [Amycolatopsis magusensis]|uniref:hypothetical protein n=1 Tax=Amycolatopsis magusensis TaxID=882444 RepID=UPI00378EB4FC
MAGRLLTDGTERTTRKILAALVPAASGLGIGATSPPGSLATGGPLLHHHCANVQ